MCTNLAGVFPGKFLHWNLLIIIMRGWITGVLGTHIVGNRFEALGDSIEGTAIRGHGNSFTTLAIGLINNKCKIIFENRLAQAPKRTQPR